MTIHTRLIALFLSLLIVLQGCGGGTLADGGMSGSGISTGSVTGFGSIFVNGVEFQTTAAQINVNGQVFSNVDDTTLQTILNKGMVVTVRGTIDPGGATGIANVVTYARILEGPISGNPAASSFIAMGQTVIVDSQTVYAGVTGLSDLNDADVVEVSGFVDPAGNIRATFIEKTTSLTHEITGQVTAIGTNQFNIGALVVNWTGSTVTVSSFVAVKGQMNGSGQLDAISVNSIDPGFGIADADDAELEGLAQTACLPDAANPPCEFTLGAQTVRVSAGTELKGGVIADIQPGVRLEVEGALVNGTLIADKVDFEAGIELEAGVDSVTEDPVAGTKTLTLTGLAGTSVILDSVSTNFDGLTYGAINDTVYLKIRGRALGNQVTATRVESGSRPDVRLQAPVQNFDPNVSLTVLGITLNTVTNNLVGPQFYANLQVGDTVGAEGILNNSGEVDWQSVKLED
ncbi:MAG: DUF5666 domain-containing protein [Proteobacteria bacterium]|nr:DUF5666 domain-containing protein [Pseudomonadota bacterium]